MSFQPPAGCPPDGAHATWVEVVSCHAVVTAGIRVLLQEHGDQRFTTSGSIDATPDVVLYDVIGLHDGDGADLDRWVRRAPSAVVALTRELRPELGALALARGARTAVSLAASADDLVEVIRAVLDGTADLAPAVRAATGATRLGWEVDLTRREAEVISLIVRGLSNQEIARECNVSINSVKSYIRGAYRKMQVDSRSQAVGWGVRHGFAVATD